MGGVNLPSLEQDCLALKAQGLAPSTHRTYNSEQLCFVNFCSQAGHFHLSGSSCPANEWTLCLFATHLSSLLCSASIKIYLSAIHSMHIYLGFPDPLVDCLQLLCVLRGIKQTQGSPGSSHLPITDYHMLVIHQSVSLTNHYHVMLWAASTLTYFGFLRSSEFTVSSLSASTPSSICKSATLLWILTPRLPIFKLASRLPRPHTQKGWTWGFFEGKDGPMVSVP